MELGDGASVKVQRRKGGDWRTVGRLSGPGTKVTVLPLYPDRLDSLRLRLEGEGPCVIRTLAREYLTGSVYGGEAGA